MNTCANCGGGIGKLETPFVWKDHTVCAVCFAKLKQAAALAGDTIPYATPTRRRGDRHVWGIALSIICVLAVAVLFIALVGVRQSRSIPVKTMLPPTAPAAATQPINVTRDQVIDAIPADR